MTNPTIYSGSERILRAGVFCTLLDLTLTYTEPTISFEDNNTVADGIAEMTDFLSVGIVLEDTFCALKEYFYKKVYPKPQKI